MAAGSVHVPWYATALRADRLEEALSGIAPISLRYGATSYQVFRYRDDRYKFLQVFTFEDKLDWERFWAGKEFERFRTLNNSFYQVPVVYQWADVSAEGSLARDPIASGPPSSVTAPGGGGDMT